MREYGFQWRMAMRRMASCLLVVLFTAVVTVFMLTYPRLIESTESRLEEAYSTIEVNGWMLNTMSFEDLKIPGNLRKELVEDGFFRREHSYSNGNLGLIEAGILDSLVEEELKQEVSAENRMEMLKKLKMDKNRISMISREVVRAFNCGEASAELQKLQKQEAVQWAEGYSADCLKGDEMLCILPASMGYLPGDVIPVVAVGKTDWGGILQLTVAAAYEGQNGDYDIILPLETYEKICGENGGKFFINSMIFDIEDNHRLQEFKAKLVELGLDGSGEEAVRAAIDDRILQGTVAPIESNLAMLEGLFAFFFAVIVVIGFFLCFLLARNRKAEYAVMRMLGESVARITGKALSEQSILCLIGIAVGAVLVTVTQLGKAEPLICGAILLCYTVGAAVAVLMTVRVNVMEILRDKE